VVAVSEEDAAIIRRRFGMPRVDVVDNGIDRVFFEGVEGQRDPRRILFLGALDWRPNLDAVGLLLDRIFPEVLRQVPAARLCVVGRHPPAGLKQRLARCPGVELHADVADVRPFLAGCGVMAVPLRIGGGSRLKILEALGSGLPVVSTRVGAEGLCLTAERDLLVSQDTEDFPTALLQALRQPERMQDMARQARPRVLERYDWNHLADKLEQAWVRCARGAD
jgi:glycosyltransferase involved in cell wall biosynthesis